MLTQCADQNQNNRLQKSNINAARPQQPVYQPSYYEPYSRAYSNPYDFSPSQNYTVPIDNDQTYSLPKEYIIDRK